MRSGGNQWGLALKVWSEIQEHLNGSVRAPARSDINEDFPLRGFICCDDCGNPLNANWSKSKAGKKHPYDMCFTKGCESYLKSIRRDVLEGEFVELLEGMQRFQSLLTLSTVMFANAWGQRIARSGAVFATLKRDIAKIEKQIEGFLDRIVEASTPSVISVYETRIEKMEREKLVL